VKPVASWLRSTIWFATFPLLRRISRLRDLHKGQECFIFGDGASVKYFDLSSFADRIGIAVNAFPRHRDAHLTDIRYWIVAEPGFLLPPILKSSMNRVEGFRNRVRFQSLFKRQSRDQLDLVRITSVANLLGEAGRNTYHIWDRLPTRGKRRGCVSNQNSFAGSMTTALTIAAHLGFTRAFLVGFDYTHNPATSFHWYEGLPPTSSPELQMSYLIDFFNEITQCLEVVTITPTPQRTELPSIDYPSFTGKQLHHRENIELLDTEDFKTLSLNPGYRMFGAL
jgi:hypothetical protein